ncbi:hypothetical protein ACPPVU_10415 [Mucilaginibacter sp. McL0603]|uniref:hypothetical protein n=1 Tax=Mucilaginibacter sp. McL0603 TaxID=3415670 RepID=UPI003CF6C6F3
MKLYCAIIFILTLFTGTHKFGEYDQKDMVSGTWRGTSICQVKDSPCHDEMAVYHASKAEGNTYHFQMNKMVNGKEEEMGMLVFAYNDSLKTLVAVSNSPNRGKATWKFTIKGDTMHGTLIVDNNILYRMIDLHKD